MSAGNAAARCVITGIGVVAPNGVGTHEHWRATLAGDLCVHPIEPFEATGYATPLAGQVPGFGPRSTSTNGSSSRRTAGPGWRSRAAQLALDDAAYDPAAHEAYDTSVILGSGSGGNEFGQREIQALWSRGRRRSAPTSRSPGSTRRAPARSRSGTARRDPLAVLISEAAGGLDSIGWARRTIRRGTPTVVTGGTEAPISPYALACQITSGRTSSATDPRAGYKPFDSQTTGQVPGEGGAVLVVEDAAAAAARAAPRVYGEVAGYAATHDAYHYEKSAPDEPAVRACHGACTSERRCRSIGRGPDRR